MHNLLWFCFLNCITSYSTNNFQVQHSAETGELKAAETEFLYAALTFEIVSLRVSSHFNQMILITKMINLSYEHKKRMEF